jgi:GTPase
LQVLGYDEEGRVLNYVGVATPTPADVTAAASHIVNFIDIGGHEKYMKTTLYGMTCLLPGRVMVLELPVLMTIAAGNGMWLCLPHCLERC